MSVEQFQEQYDPTSRGPRSLQHHLSICQVNEQQVSLCLHINHAIIDGYSRELLLRDLKTALSTNLDYTGGLYGNFISYLKQQSHDEARDYWMQYLAGIEPCYFPDLGDGVQGVPRDGVMKVPNIHPGKVHAFCLEWEVTLATIVQTAWALVLNRYTGSATPCFGNITSGRDLPVADVGDILGPLIGMLTCRVQLDRTQTVLETLKKVQEDYLNSLQYQTFPLASVHNSLGLGRSALFNTVMSLQRLNTAEENNMSDLSLAFNGGIDPTEVRCHADAYPLIYMKDLELTRINSTI